MKQISVRLEDDLYKTIKHHLIDINISFNAYVLKLIQDDLKKLDKI